MNELECTDCCNDTTCSEDAISVICYDCVTERIYQLDDG
jgi:hypothetical protein